MTQKGDRTTMIKMEEKTMPDASPIFEDIFNLLKQLYRQYNEANIIKEKLSRDLKKTITALINKLQLDISPDTDIKFYLELKGKYYYIRIHTKEKKHSKYLGSDEEKAKEIENTIHQIRQLRFELNHKISWWIRDVERKMNEIYETLLQIKDNYEYAFEE